MNVLYKRIYCRYSQKIDMLDAESTFIENLLDKEDFVSEAEIETYMQVWNKVSWIRVIFDNAHKLFSCSFCSMINFLQH